MSGDAEFVAVQLPYGQQSDQADVDIALEFIAPTLTCNVDIKSMVDAASSAAAQGLGVEQISDFVRGNIKARQRMVAQYTIAGERNLLVVGTDHAAEAVTGFFTKYGDGGSDVNPLAGLTKSQGAQLLRHLGAPESTWTKVPTADLEDDRPALPDEEALGVNYADTHQSEDSYLSRQTLPFIPGSEVVGTTQDGKRVCGLLMGGGGYAEKASVPVSGVFEVPDNVSDAAAVSLLIQGLTAWHLHRTAARVRPGDAVVVISGAGGTGSLLLQLARPMGAGRVIATASSRSKRDLCLECAVLSYIERVCRLCSDGLVHPDQDLA